MVAGDPTWTLGQNRRKGETIIITIVKKKNDDNKHRKNKLTSYGYFYE